ncbi:MAG TPA: hypothetical protein VGB45_15815, partial [Abditibacterium sp.]
MNETFSSETTLDEGNILPAGIDALLLKRCKGARTMRGVRYQILLSLLHAFELWEPDAVYSALQLEGFEDFDLHGSANGNVFAPNASHADLKPYQLGNRYVQAKTADRPWTWSQLKKPLQGFLEQQRAYTNDLTVVPNECFVLAVDFALTGDIARLAQFNTIPAKERPTLSASFRRLCREIGATSGEADTLLSKLEIVSYPEAQLILDLKRTLATCFELTTGVDEYLLSCVAQFLEWATERKIVTREDLADIRVRVAESRAKEVSFEAIGRGLIERLEWKNDANEDEFFAGKSTRPGHINAALDARRPHWEKRIAQAASTSGVVIVRSASGQGKSTLCLRYARESWPHNHTFTLRFARNEVEVEQVRHFLDFRVRQLHLDTFLLIDNAGRHTPLWPLIAQECAALGVPVLLTMRHEDWYRYARHDLFVFDVVEPHLELEEAREIWSQFAAAERIHLDAPSAEEAYDRIGEPHLLMEYVFLVTQGEMLADRLRDQVRTFSQSGEDPIKREILRRVAVADALGAPVEISALLRGLPLRDDPQDVLQSLQNEYLALSNGQLSGLHWVRSDHLVKLLHEGYPPVSQTALAVFEAVPHESLAPFVANAICRSEVETPMFLDGIVERAKEYWQRGETAHIFALLEGLFEAGERQYLSSHAAFDTAYAEFGPGGPLLIKGDWAPTIRPRLIHTLHGDNYTGTGIERLRAISATGQEGQRGHDLCRNLLQNLVEGESEAWFRALEAAPGQAGLWLSWLALSQ